MGENVCINGIHVARYKVTAVERKAKPAQNRYFVATSPLQVYNPLIERKEA